MASNPENVASLPRPRFVARVGVTGHRRNNLAYAAAKLDDAIGKTLREVDRALRAAHGAHAADYADEAPMIRMTSGLADGADQSAAHARPTSWILDAILPMPIAQYRRDFIQLDGRYDAAVTTFDTLIREAEAVLELAADPTCDHDASCYARQGRILVQQTDLLVAIWDGKPSRGAGGTAEVIARALDQRLPVVCVPLSGDGEPALLCDDRGAVDDLGRLPPLLSDLFCLRAPSEPDGGTVAFENTPSQMANSNHGWDDLLSQLRGLGPFADRLRSAASPLLRSPDRGLVAAARLAILLLPIAGLSRSVARDRVSEYVLRRLNALSREVAFPSACFDADYVAAHCNRIAETVAYQPDVVAMLRRVGRESSFDEVCSVLATIALQISGLCGSAQAAGCC